MKDLKLSIEISRELASSVLGLNVVYYTESCEHRDGIIGIWTDINNTKPIEEISIYGFAFKCKEWAISKGYIIKSKPYDYNEDTTFSGGYFWITRIEDGHCPNYGANRSEVQAIIDGCEWILRKNNKSL